MSIHYDGEPRWTPMVDQLAKTLLNDLVVAKEKITSLDFKLALRERAEKGLGGTERQATIVQEDVHRFLMKWSTSGRMSADGYDYREETPPAGATARVYNVYEPKRREQKFVGEPSAVSMQQRDSNGKLYRLRYYVGREKTSDKLVVFSTRLTKKDMLAERNLHPDDVIGPLPKKAAEDMVAEREATRVRRS